MFFSYFFSQGAQANGGLSTSRLVFPTKPPPIGRRLIGRYSCGVERLKLESGFLASVLHFPVQRVCETFWRVLLFAF